MAEPVFKLLRCDAEASHMLGWAKKQVKRVIEHAKLDSFQRSWSFGDVTVKASYFAGVARLWLEAAGTERLVIGMKLPDPYPFRVLFTTAMTLGSPSITTSTTAVPMEWGLKIVEHYVMRDPFGAVVREWDGIQEPGYSGDNRSLTFTSWLKIGGGSSYVYQGLPVTVFTVGINESWHEISGTVVENGNSGVYAYPTTPAYSTLLREVNESIAVVTSDAQILAVSPVQTSGNVTTYRHQAFSPYCVAAFIEDATALPATYAFSHMLNPGVIAPDLIDAFVKHDDVFPPYYFDNGRETVEAAWYAYRDAAVARRKTLFKQHTDDIVAALKTGAPLPIAWDYWIKSNAPYSVHVRRSIPIAYSYVDTFPTTALTERTVTFLYSYTNTAGEVVHVSKTIIGRKEFIYTNHYYAHNGQFAGQSRKEIYADWFVPPGAISPTLIEGTNQYVPHAFIADGSRQFTWSTAKGMGLLWSGELTSIYYGSFYYPDSAVVVPSTPPWLQVTPMPAPYRNTLTAYLPEFLYAWHQRSSQKYDPNYTSNIPDDRAWVSSALLPGMNVTLIPFAKVKNGTSYGAFNARMPNAPTAVDDAEDADEIEVYGAATYSYERTGGFKFSRWTPLADGAQSKRVAKPEGAWPDYNVIVIYNNEKFGDVKEDARAQRKALNDPNDPAHDPLMKAVLDALKPPEPAP